MTYFNHNVKHFNSYFYDIRWFYSPEVVKFDAEYVILSTLLVKPTTRFNSEHARPTLFPDNFIDSKALETKL